MLQWMGGSRRKVYASRKSTQSRQKQYFEQKKRQQQRPGQENQIDVTGKQEYHPEEPRSLDILSLYYFATPNSYRNCGEGSQSRLPSPFGHQHVATAVNSQEQPLGNKISTSKNTNVKQRDRNEELQSDISLIDLVSDDGSKNKSTEQPAREAHVAFSVKGLGNVQMETPPHTPRSIKRIFPSPPKATRHIQTKARRSIPFDATKELNSIMNDVNMLKDWRLPDGMECVGAFLDESSYERSKQFHYYSPNSSGNLNDNSYGGDEDMFYELEAEKAKCGNLDGNLFDENSDRLWKIDPLNSEGHFPTPRAEQLDTFDYSFKDRYSPKLRASTRTSTRFETSGTPSSHDPLFGHSTLDDDEDAVLFDCERPPPIKMSNFNCSFGPDWSLNAVEDLEKRSSPLSEESCSSAAVIQDISYKQPTQSVKCKESRKYEKDDFHINLDKLDIPKMDEYLDGVSPFSDQAEVDHKRTADLKNFDRGYWAEKTIEQQRITQPSCHLSLKDNLASWTSSPHLKGGIGPDNPPLDCTVMCEDKPFDSIPDMNSYQTIGSVERTHTSKVPPIIHRPGDASFENDMSKDRLFTKIPLQKCLLDIFDDTSEFSNTFCTAETQNGIDINTFSAQNKVGKNKENFETFKNPKTDIFLAMKSVSSVSHRTAVGEHSSASGKDSFRQGFSPAIHLQKSRPDSFPEEDHDICEFSNGNFQGDLELSSHLARENGDKIETFEIPHTKMLVTEESQPSESCRNEMSETEAGSDGSEVKIRPEELKEASVVTEQIPADVSCLQETLAEMVQVHAHVKCIIKEKLENSNVDFKTPSNSTNKFCNIGDPPFVGEVGIEKKVIASIGSNNCDVQYQFMLERRVLQQLCVQKVLLDTPIKEKLHKDGHFRMFESRYGILPRSV